MGQCCCKQATCQLLLDHLYGEWELLLCFSLSVTTEVRLSELHIDVKYVSRGPWEEGLGTCLATFTLSPQRLQHTKF